MTKAGHKPEHRTTYHYTGSMHAVRAGLKKRANSEVIKGTRNDLHGNLKTKTSKPENC